MGFFFFLKVNTACQRNVSGIAKHTRLGTLHAVYNRSQDDFNFI